MKLVWVDCKRCSEGCEFRASGYRVSGLSSGVGRSGHQ